MYILDEFTVLMVIAITDVTLFDATWNSCYAKNLYEIYYSYWTCQ